MSNNKSLMFVLCCLPYSLGFGKSLATEIKIENNEVKKKLSPPSSSEAIRVLDALKYQDLHLTFYDAFEADLEESLLWEEYGLENDDKDEVVQINPTIAAFFSKSLQRNFKSKKNDEPVESVNKYITM